MNCTCQQCFEEIDLDDSNIFCKECNGKLFPADDLELAIEEVSDKKYHWESRDGYIGFNSEEDLTLFLDGVKQGYSDALFWMCDYFGMVEFFEDSIANKFRNSKTENGSCTIK